MNFSYHRYSRFFFLSIKFYYIQLNIEHFLLADRSHKCSSDKTGKLFALL